MPLLISAEVIEAWIRKGWRVIHQHRIMLVEEEQLVYPLLPSGYWPRTGTRKESDSSGRSVVTPSIDLGRFEFLRRIGPIRELVGLKGLGSDYRAFVVRSASGRSIVLADSPRYANAVYVFDGETEWLPAARMTRYTLKQLQPPELIRRITHHKGWEERTLKFLADS